MKTEFQAKYLQHLIKKKNKDEGFTLIELLVVIIIIGILAAIALPSFLNQASKARGAEAKTNVGAMNRAQQSYYVEQQNFTSNVSDLGLSFPTTSQNFNYSIANVTSGSTAGANNRGTAKANDVKSYGGYVAYSTTGTATILCEAKSAGGGAVDISSFSCPGTATEVK